MAGKCPLSSMSLLDPAIQSRPYDFYAAIHEQGPVYVMPETGAYVVCGYDALTRVLRDTENFSSDIGDNYFQIQGEAGARLYKSILAARGWDHVKTLQRTDPPLHGRYRRLVDQVFSLAHVRTMKTRIESLCHELVDSFIDRGECEFIADFALPLPGIIIAEQLGLDASELQRFKNWADTLVNTASMVMDEAQLKAAAEIELDMQHYLAAMHAERSVAPKDDLISNLIHAETEGEPPLSMAEFQNVMHQLVSGGFDTTTNALAHGLWLLIQHPDQMAKLRANPGLRRSFIDESLRLESPAQGLMRRAVNDVQIGDTLIPAGAHVIVRYGAANQDPAKFPEPRRFDIERNNAGSSLAFGSGAHFCVGRLLAKQELDTAFDVLLSRLDNIELARPLPEPPHHENLFLRPLKELPIRFTRA